MSIRYIITVIYVYDLSKYEGSLSFVLNDLNMSKYLDISNVIFRWCNDYLMHLCCAGRLQMCVSISGVVHCIWTMCNNNATAPRGHSRCASLHCEAARAHAVATKVKLGPIACSLFLL